MYFAQFLVIFFFKRIVGGYLIKNVLSVEDPLLIKHLFQNKRLAVSC